ncbi:terminase large subunit [Mangrovibrevibacter kandeliae]|uniref:terminase large subunit n=1 Tax=Mangrovibrevibacter kandeliae TaxID=2968473 RepID=UPI0021194FC9|nr:terminase TerL endonuclease subunit [Aurantimonas sp. CSK15Z-1]MCQ8781711.1 terminase large subunit [Aurantimonas sp. CSK15Z-1]
MALRYARAVADGQVPACRLIILACERYLRMLSRSFQDAEGIYFSAEDAIEACAFIETLHHVKGTLAGEHFRIEPYQMWMVCAIYGFRWDADGLRVVNDVYAELPRKHGKSLLASGIGLYETTVLANQGDDLYIIAPKFDQGLKILEPYQKMVAHNRPLEQMFGIQSTKKASYVERTDTQVVVLSSIGEKQDGHDPKTVIGDEFHAIPADIYNVMQSAQRARPESLFLKIGSAGRHTFGTGWDERRAAIDTLEGRTSRLNLFAAIYTVDPEDVRDWDKEHVIRKASPGLGVSVDLRKTMQDAQAAKANPAKKSEFLRTALNLWGFGENVLFPPEKWEQASRPSMRIEHCLGLRGWVGLDLASRNDMVAMVALFERETGDLVKTEDGFIADTDLYAFGRFYVPQLGPWVEDEDLAGPYQAWREKGWLTVTPGSRHNYAQLRRDLFALFDAGHDIQAVVIDDQQANEFFAALQEANKPVVAYRKNASNHSDPTKDLMARVNGEEQSLFHDGNGVLAWNMANVIGGTDTADRILGKKPAPNSTQKIDGFDALVQANAARLQMVEIKQPRGPNPMAQRGMRIL